MLGSMPGMSEGAQANRSKFFLNSSIRPFSSEGASKVPIFVD